MNRPITALVIISWYNDKNELHSESYTQDDLESAYTLLGLMIGEITEEDLKP